MGRNSDSYPDIGVTVTYTFPVFRNVAGKNQRIARIPMGNTPLETNMSPENQWLEDVFPTKIIPF